MSSAPLHMRVADRIRMRLFAWFTNFERRVYKLRSESLIAKMASCGEGTILHGPTRITGADRVRLGRNVHIAENAFIRAEGGLTIGENTHISRNLVLYTVNHRHDGDRIPYDEALIEKPVSIGRNVWVGMNVCITPGTKIGDGAIVGMGTVVSGEVPPLSVIGSQPWRVLRERDADHYARLDAEGAYGGINGTPIRGI